MSSDTVTLDDFRQWLSKKLNYHQKHREALRDSGVTGGADENNLAIDNYEKAYAPATKFEQELRGEVPPEKAD